MKKIAITGGLSSGKTTVCQILESLGVYSISADALVHELLSPKSLVGQQVIQLLGTEIVENQNINRKKIADIVFSNPNKLRALEEILHPAVFRAIDEHYEKALKGNYPLFAAEIPLLFEAQASSHFDASIAVVADETVAKKRFQEKTKSDVLEYNRRAQQQWPAEKKAEHATYVIDNNGSLEHLKHQVHVLYSILTQ